MRNKYIGKREDRWFGVWFVVCAVLGLAVTGVIVWAIIRLVLHFTG